MKRKNIFIVIICGIILLIASGVVYVIFSTEPTAQSEGATKTSAMLVSVTLVNEGQFTPEFIATGTVQPVEEVLLNAMVSGQVIERSVDFVPGGMVRKGQVLLKIDSADYQYELDLRKSELLQAQSDLELEMGRQKIAQQDLALVGNDSISDDQKFLVLRQPQLNAIKAQIKLAEANYNQAQLNLDRTSVKAPFDAHVISQAVTVGSRVSPGGNLGKLVGTHEYWVTATIPIDKLKWLSFPSSARGNGAPVIIRNYTSWQEGQFRMGNLYNQIGSLDRQTRLARILIRVPDPLGYQSRNRSKPKLLIGEFVEVRIQGRKTEELVKLNRDYIRTNQTVWVMEEGKLAIRKVSIELLDAEFAYITEGLEDGESVVTSNISTVTEGVPLRTESETTNNSIDSTQQNTK